MRGEELRILREGGKILAGRKKDLRERNDGRMVELMKEEKRNEGFFFFIGMKERKRKKRRKER